MLSLIIATSFSGYHESVKNLLKILPNGYSDPPTRESGCGKKMMNIVQRKIDCMLYNYAGKSKNDKIDFS